MKQYEAETMSRREMRKCFSRYAISVVLSCIAMQTGALAGVALLRWLWPGYASDPFYGPILTVAVNDIASYVPALLFFWLLLRKLPEAEPIPVDRLSLWELLQAAVFSIGIGYFFSYLNEFLIMGLEQAVGLSSSNAVNDLESYLPSWLTVLTFVVIAPVFEELIFRRALLRRLRGLGDTAAVLLSALAFALFHGNLYQTLYAFVLGMVFAAIVLLTGSIRDTILLHMLINGMSVVVMLAGEAETVMLVFEAVILVSMPVALVMFFRTRKNYHMEPGPLPFRPREKRGACLRSVWFWLMLVLGLGFSVLTIFL